MEEKERLYYKYARQLSGNEDIRLIVLTDKDNERLITLICEAATANAIELRVNNRNPTKNQLPEVTMKMLRERGALNLEFTISDIEDGQYISYIYDGDKDKKYQIRASDGILFAIVANIPIYIDSELMKRQAMKDRGLLTRINVPVNTLTTSMLEENLQKALDNEDYRTASTLHNELEKRKKNHISE